MGGRTRCAWGGVSDNLRRRAACAVLLLAGACLGPSHPPEALTRIGFRSPRQTFETFFAAFDYRIYGLEFRCLSEGFKRRNGVSDLTWREFRDELEREHALLRLAARAEIVEERVEGPDSHWIVARAAGRTVRLHFVREEFFEIYAGDLRATDGVPTDGRPWKFDRNAARVTAAVDLEPEVAATLDSASISEFRVGFEWKLDDFVEDPDAHP